MKTKFLNASVLIAVGFAVMTADSAAAEDLGSRQPAAEAPIQLTLEDAVRRAIENNPDLVVVRLDTEVEAARTAQTRAAYFHALDDARAVECRHASLDAAGRRAGRGR